MHLINNISRMPAEAFEYASQQLLDDLSEIFMNMIEYTAKLTANYMVGDAPFGVVPVGKPDLIIYEDGTASMVQSAFCVDSDGEHPVNLLVVPPRSLPADSFFCKGAVEEEV